MNKEIYPHTLSPTDKRIYFEGLKVLKPEKAKLMSEDTFVQGLKSKFGAMFVIYQKEYDECYAKGLEITNNLNQQRSKP